MILSPPAKPKMLLEPIAGTVEQAVFHNQLGRVKCQATYWPAKIYQPDGKVYILPGQPVIIVGIEGITLLVVPV